jgi:hypothetical protein
VCFTNSGHTWHFRTINFNITINRNQLNRSPISSRHLTSAHTWQAIPSPAFTLIPTYTGYDCIIGMPKIEYLDKNGIISYDLYPLGSVVLVDVRLRRAVYNETLKDEEGVCR